MLYRAFKGLLVSLISELFEWMQENASNLIETSLRIEQAVGTWGNPITAELIDRIYIFVYGTVLMLVSLKLIWKGINVYILWRDGDAEVSPHALLVGAAIAILASVAFPMLYNIGVSATAEIGNGIVAQINGSWGGDSGGSFDAAVAAENAEKAWYLHFDEFDKNKNRVIDGNEDDEDSEYNAVWLAFVALEQESEITDTEQEFSDIVFFTINNNQPISPAGVKAYFVDQANNLFSKERLKVFNLGTLIALLIYCIMYLIMYIKLVGRSIEMLFLRLGFPIAAIGYVNSDGGVMHSYVQLIFRQYVTSIMQVVAMYLSYYALAKMQIFLGLAMAVAAFTSPVLLNQLLTPQKQGPGFGQRLNQGLHTVSLIRTLRGGGR